MLKAAPSGPRSSTSRSRKDAPIAARPNAAATSQGGPTGLNDMVQIVQGQLFTSTEDHDEEDDESYLRKLSNIQTKKKKKAGGVVTQVKREPDGIINVYSPAQAEGRKECKDPMI